MPQRLPAVAPDTLSAEARALHDSSPLALFGVLGHATTYVPLLGYLTAQQQTEVLRARLKEMAILRVAALEGAEYEWVQHEPRALAAGVRPDEVAALRNGDELPASERPAISLVEELVRGAHPRDETVAATRALLGVGGVIDLTLLVANYMLVARIIGVAGLPPDPPAASPGPA